MNFREFLILTLVCTIWGLHFVVMKVTVGQTAPPLFYAAVRMTIVAIILLPFLKWHTGMMSKILLGGLGFGAFNYAFMFPALGMTTASAAALTIELYVPFSIILSVLFLGERIGYRRIIGIALAFAGVALIALAKPDEEAGPRFLLGILMMACAAMSEAIGAIMVKKVEGVKPLQLLVWFAIVGSAVLLPLSLVLEDNQLLSFSSENRWPFIGALLYSSLAVSLIAHGSYYWLLQRLPVYIVSTSGLMTTLVAVTASVLILKDPLTPPFLIGGTMTLCGIGFILYARKQRLSAKPTQIELH